MRETATLPTGSALQAFGREPSTLMAPALVAVGLAAVVACASEPAGRTPGGLAPNQQHGVSMLYPHDYKAAHADDDLQPAALVR
jgi:hypothetical protein